MNKLFIIGNGFDLAHGLKTKYSDFLLWYLNEKLKQSISGNCPDDGISTLHTIANFPKDRFESIDDFLNMKPPYLEKRSIHNFFEEILRNHRDPNWIDIEYTYYQFLKDYYRTIERQHANLRGFNIGLEAKKLNDCLDNIKKQLNNYLNRIESPKVHAKIHSILQKEIIKVQRENMTLKGSVPYQIHLLIFNYTSTIDIYNNLLPSDITTKNYIHGKLGDDLDHIIFGYGDETDEYYQKIENINSNEFLRNIKSFSYLKTGNYLELSRFIESRDFEVLIMGHSCGLSDRVLLKSIFERQNCKCIRIFYHDRGKNSTDFFEKTQEISRHFRAELKDEMRSKIIPFDKCESLN